MATKDRDLVKQQQTVAPRGPARLSPAVEAPQAGVKLQQGATADMQQNVGNSGLKELISDQEKKSGPARDPSRMGPDEMKAQAKADVEKLSSKKRKNADDKCAPQRGDEAGLEAKEKAKLEADASRKKTEAEAEKQKAQAEEAKKATAKKKPAAKAEAKPAAEPVFARGDVATKGRPAADKKKAEAKTGKAVPPVKKGEIEPGKESIQRTATVKKVDAKQADADHAKAKAEVAKDAASKKKTELKEPKAAKNKL
ncbi:MAG: hypothetical protein FJ090_07285, partial [Deltaproteobacteria bacterium]|nr:hypothetical protein [Deltaproteobacteria bacterium]